MHAWPLLLAFAAAPQIDMEFVAGPVNGLLLRQGGKTLAVYGDPRGKQAAEIALLCSARRDTAWAARGAAQIAAPAAEARFLENPLQFWQSFYDKDRLHDYANQGIKWPAAPMGPVRAVREGDRIDWHGLSIEVAETPGFTRGAVSYLFTLDGRRIAATGDLILEDGRIFDLYSLQDAIPELKVRGYHGYASRASQLIRSLRRIEAWKPDLIVPVRGPLIREPLPAIRRLIARLQAVYANYLHTDAYRWYFGDENWRARAARVLDQPARPPMPQAEIPAQQPPEWIRPIGNSRLVISGSGAALLMDAGYSRLPDELRKLQAAGVFRTLEEIHITHYHDDHTDVAQALSAAWNAPVFATPFQRPILENPAAFRMPCLTGNPIQRVKEMKNGETRNWHEFRLTKFDLPGQTLYHDGLLVERNPGQPTSEAVFFAGDSFTPTGLDDYCLLNRNPIGEGSGFLKSIEALRRLPARTLLINQHVTPVFRFSEEQLGEMEKSLRERATLLRDLLQWRDINFGLDEQWARLDPHVRDAAAGSTITVRAVAWNHSARAARIEVRPVLPPGWRGSNVRIQAPPHGEAEARFDVTIPASAAGLHVLTADVALDGKVLSEWCEALVMVRARR